jgi:hypothetical protein
VVFEFVLITPPFFIYKDIKQRVVWATEAMLVIVIALGVSMAMRKRHRRAGHGR